MRIDRSDRVTHLVLDLDPPEDDDSFARAVGAAQLVRRALDDSGLEGVVKTSGAKGLHVFVPVDDEVPLAPTREFAAPLLGVVGEATAEVVEASDGAIVPGDVVGLSGLQARYDERLRGISIMACDLETARRLSNEDPAVRAGRLAAEVMTWMVPAGNVRFEKVPGPRSLAEAAED